MQITKTDVQKVAKLARLDLTEAEKEAFTKQLSQILDHVQHLNSYKTEGVQPTATVLGQVNVFREDVVRQSLSTEKALANAPDKDENHFRVPKIVDEREA